MLVVAAIFIVVVHRAVCFLKYPGIFVFSRRIYKYLYLFLSSVKHLVTRGSNMAQYKGAASEAGRAMHLMKKREREREQLEQLKQKIAEVCTFYLIKNYVYFF